MGYRREMLLAMKIMGVPQNIAYVKMNASKA